MVADNVKFTINLALNFTYNLTKKGVNGACYRAISCDHRACDSAKYRL